MWPVALGLVAGEEVRSDSLDERSVDDEGSAVPAVALSRSELTKDRLSVSEDEEQLWTTLVPKWLAKTKPGLACALGVIRRGDALMSLYPGEEVSDRVDVWLCCMLK